MSSSLKNEGIQIESKQGDWVNSELKFSSRPEGKWRLEKNCKITLGNPSAYFLYRYSERNL